MALTKLVTKGAMFILLAAVLLLSGCHTHKEGLTSGVIEINGSALSPNFSNFSLSHGLGVNPTTFSTDGITLTGNGLSSVNNSVLGFWDTKGLAPGLYALKLEIHDTFGQATKDFLYFNIDNIQITLPQNGSALSRNESVIDLKGTVYLSAQDFSSYTIKAGLDNASLSSNNITLTNGGTAIVENGVLAKWNITDLNLASYLVELVVLFQNGSNKTLQYTYDVLDLDAYEPDNNFTLASTIVPDGVAQIHSLLPENDTDYVKFTADANTIYQIETFNLSNSADTFMELYDTDGVTLLDEDDDSGEDLASRIVFTPKANGTYFVNVKGFDEFTTGVYKLKVVTLTPDVYEPDDELSNATPIETNGTAQEHNFLPDFDTDYVTFNVTNGSYYDILTFDLINSADTVITLVDGNNNELAFDDDKGFEFLASRIVFRADADEQVYLRITDFSFSAGGIYNVSVLEVSLVEDQFEPDNTFNTANPIAVNETQEHDFVITDDVDFVSFNTTEENVLFTIKTFNLENFADTVLSLYDDADEVALVDVDDDGGDEFLASKIEFLAQANKTYYVGVRSYAGFPDGTYNLTLLSNASGGGGIPNNASVTFTPAESVLYLFVNDTQDFTINITGTNIDLTDIIWFVDNNVELKDQDVNFSSFTFQNDTPGNYSVEVDVFVDFFDGNTDLFEENWTVVVLSAPQSENFTGTFQNVTLDDLENATGITIENSAGKIDFGSSVLNLSSIINLDPFVLISNAGVGVDSANANALNHSAKVTLTGLSFNETPIIKVNEGFGVAGSTDCPSSRCSNIVFNNGTLTFDVTHFSTFFPQANTSSNGSSNGSTQGSLDFTIPGSVQLGDDNQKRNRNISTTFIIKNTGNGTLTNINFTLVILDSTATINENALNLQLVNVPSSLTQGQSQTVTVKTFIPLDFDAVDAICQERAFTVGRVTITGGNDTSNISKTMDIALQAKNNLDIRDADLCVNTACQSIDDGDQVRDLRPGDEVELIVEVKNTFDDDSDNDDGTEDIEMTEVELTIKVDDRDFDIEESEDCD